MIRAAAFVFARTRPDLSLPSKYKPRRSKRVVRSTDALAVPPNPGKRKLPSLQTHAALKPKLTPLSFPLIFLCPCFSFFPSSLFALSLSLSSRRMPDLPGDRERSLRSVDSEDLVSLGTFPKNCSPGRVPLPPKRNRGGGDSGEGVRDEGHVQHRSGKRAAEKTQ